MSHTNAAATAGDGDDEASACSSSSCDGLVRRDQLEVVDFAASYSLEPIVHLPIFQTSNSRLLKKLRDDMKRDEGAYEIHQLYKTIHFRSAAFSLFSLIYILYVFVEIDDLMLVCRGMTSGLIEDCIELVYNGVCYFASKKNVVFCCSLLARC